MAFDDDTSLLYLAFSDSIRTYQYSTNSSLIPNGTFWNQSVFYMMIDVLHSLLFVTTGQNTLVALDLNSSYNFTTLTVGITTFAINPRAEEIYFANTYYTLFKLLYHSSQPIVLDQSFATLNGIALANETLLWSSVLPMEVGSMQFDGSNRSATTENYGPPSALAFDPGIKRVVQVLFCLVEKAIDPCVVLIDFQFPMIQCILCISEKDMVFLWQCMNSTGRNSIPLTSATAKLLH